MDYKKLGLKAGLEIHQQLDTHKLFCECPSELMEGEPDKKIGRKLHAVPGEMGEVDRAALQEYLRDREFEYHFFKDVNCLVEIDEEPPRIVNKDAVDTVLTIALMLNARPVDEVHFMRKTVIDGSNVSGFQRTALLAQDGSIKIGGLEVGVPTICLEEDAARKISAKGGKVTYSLDRLGIPLIEMATDPCIRTPEEAREVAKALGDILRATRKVKRGIGTIRQDLNVSIAKGARVELKGVQELNMLHTYVENEVLRQINLLKLRDELKKRKAKKPQGKPKDVTSIFKKSSSKILKNAIEKGGVVKALKLEGFAGLLGRELQPGRRFGSELADHARAFGAAGLFHSDELPDYGITEKDIEKIKKELRAKKNDAFLLIAEDERIVDKAMSVIKPRAEAAFDGVPEETRQALPEGSSAYARPLAGGARMYPETDLPPILPDLGRLAKSLPKLPWEQVKELQKKHSLSKEVAETLYRSPYLSLFEALVSAKADAGVVAVTFTNYLQALEDPQVLQEKHFKDLFKAYSSKKFSKEAIPQILEAWAKTPGKKLDEILSSIGIEKAGKADIEKIIAKIVEKNKKLVAEQGDRAVQALMGDAMKELRGKVDGKTVMELLRKKIGK